MKLSIHRPESVLSVGMLVRFVLGGLISVVASVVATTIGAREAGVLLAFPTIMPAALTFLQEKKGKKASESNAHGAFFGSLGLLAFAFIVIALSTRVAGAACLAVAAVVWAAVAVVSFGLLHNKGPFKHVDHKV